MNNFLKKLAIKIKDLTRGRTLFDDGSYVEWYTRESIIYVDYEQNREVEVLMYFGPGLLSNRKIIIASSITEWNPPNNLIKIDKDKKNEIVNKIMKYCEKNRMKCEVDDVL